MATTTYKFPTGKTLEPPSYLSPDEVNRLGDAAEAFLVRLADLMGATVMTPGDFAGSVVAGCLHVALAAGTGFPGVAGDRKIVRTTGATTVTGLAPSTTNYVYVLQEPSGGSHFTVNQTGVPPDGSTLLLTCATNETQVTSIDNAPAGRVHFGQSILGSRRLVLDGTTKSIAGGPGDVVLVAGEYDAAVLKLTGALTGVRDVVVDADAWRLRYVWNATSGAFAVTVRTAAGGGVAVPQGAAMVLGCDGADIVALGPPAAPATGVLPAVAGGTGHGAYTVGDMLYASAAGVLTKLGIGAEGSLLRSIGGAPAWGNDQVAGLSLTDNLTLADAVNIVAGTTTGTQIGTAAGQKLGFWGTAPAVQDAGWGATNVTADRAFDADATTIDELADVLGTVVNALKVYGILGG